MNANRYNERKDILTGLSAFKKALPAFDRTVYFCLHMPAIEPMHEKELLQYAEDLCISDHIILNPLGSGYISDEQLRDLYNACSVGVNSSLGEGWGLISFEHAACGAVQIVPGHTAPAEIWQHAGIQVAAAEAVQLDTNPFLMHRINEQQLVEQLIMLVNDPVYLHQISDRCYKHALKEVFNWKLIADKWMTVLES